MFGMRALCQFLLNLDQVTVKIQSLFKKTGFLSCSPNLLGMYLMDSLYLTDEVGIKGRFSTSFALFIWEQEVSNLFVLFVP